MLAWEWHLGKWDRGGFMAAWEAILLILWDIIILHRLRWRIESWVRRKLKSSVSRFSYSFANRMLPKSKKKWKIGILHFLLSLSLLCDHPLRHLWSRQSSSLSNILLYNTSWIGKSPPSKKYCKHLKNSHSTSNQLLSSYWIFPSSCNSS